VLTTSPRTAGNTPLQAVSVCHRDRSGVPTAAVWQAVFMTLGRLLRTRARRLVAAAVVALVAIGVLVAYGVASAPAPIVPRTLTIAVPAGPGSDDTIDLDASLYVPPTVPAPAVIVAHGFGGSKLSVADDAQRLAGDGFAVL